MLVDMQRITLVMASGCYVTRNCRDVCGLNESSKPRSLRCMERIRGKKEFLKKYDGETFFKTLVL
jgi:hypothetical protein